MGMEARHAANAAEKARKAVEVIEGHLIPELGFNTTHEGLAYFARVLPTGTDEAKALWLAMGTGYSFFYNHRTVVTFDTSRPFIAAELANRLKETTPTADDDPFSVFASNESGAN